MQTHPTEFKTPVLMAIMRVSTLSKHIDSVSKMDSDASDAYVNKMTKLVKGVPIKAMLGNTTIVDQTTFDTQTIKKYMKCIVQSLGAHWISRDVVETKDEDIRRIFVKFESNTSGYLISAHLSVQFRALLYYKPDARVIKIQDELAKIEEAAQDHTKKMAQIGDQIISERFRDMGHVEPDHAKLFEMLYNDESLLSSVSADLQNAADDKGLDQYTSKRNALFASLDSLLMEVYNTTAVMIDDARLVTGEDGFLYAVDVEQILQDSRTGVMTREGNFDADEMTCDAKRVIVSRLDELRSVLVKLQQ